MVDVGAAINGTSSGALNIFVLVFVVFFLGLVVIGLVWVWMSSKRWDEFVVVIWVKDGFGQVTEKYDQGAIFVDGKTNNKRLWLKNSNVGLSTQKIPFIPIQGGKQKRIYLVQDALKNFSYVNINVRDSNLVDIDVSEEDVNWAINSYEHHKKLFQNTLLMQLLPYIAIAFVSIIILVIFIYFFKEFASLERMAASLEKMASYIYGEQAAQVIQQ